MRRFAVPVMALLAAGALLARAEERQEFHQTYPLAANGRVTIKNVNGFTHITAWDQNQVKVDAVKHARSQQGLNDVQIVVDSRADAIDIRTKYPEGENHDGGSVDYTLTVPRQAVLENVATVNGTVEIEGVAGAIKASSVNGHIALKSVEGDANLSTVNGHVEADFAKLAARTIKASSVNGPIALTLPAGAGAHLNLHSVSGSVHSDFDLPVKTARFGAGTNLDTTIGSGGPDIKLSTVNGGITLKRR